MSRPHTLTSFVLNVMHVYTINRYIKLGFAWRASRQQSASGSCLLSARRSILKLQGQLNKTLSPLLFYYFIFLVLVLVLVFHYFLFLLF